VALDPIHVARLVRVAFVTENRAAPGMKHPHVLDIALLAARLETVGNGSAHRYSWSLRGDGEGLGA
jgi:hypothetical protein